MKFNSTSKTPGVKPKVEEKLFENIIDNLGKPKVWCLEPYCKNNKNTFTHEIREVISGECVMELCKTIEDIWRIIGGFVLDMLVEQQTRHTDQLGL